MSHSSKPVESAPAGMIQPCGALLVLTADLARVLQASDNLAQVTGLAESVESRLRGSDSLGHWGGEEFVVVASHCDLAERRYPKTSAG